MIVDLSEAYGLISVSGPDASTFLQGQLTCDIRKITTTKGNFGAYCNVKGRIRALFRIFLHQDNSYYLQLPRALLPKILAQLRQYAKFSKVTLEEVSDQWQRIGIKATEEELKTLLSPLENNIVQLTVSHTPPYSRFELLGPVALMIPIWTRLSEQAHICHFEAWKLLDIRAGIPEVCPETTEQFLPHYLNLPQLGAVSFNKGCYCGQEIIARMEYRATLKRHMFHAILSGANVSDTPVVPSPGTPLWIDNGVKENIGTVISASQASENTVEMLIETLDSLVENNQILHFIETAYGEIIKHP